MRAILFGATGMLGSGTVIECLEHPDVEHLLAVGRRPSGVEHYKLTELVHDDFLDFTAVTDQFSGYDACLYCLGVSAAGMSESAYQRVTYDMTLAAAQALLEANPRMTFCFVSGAGADSTERGRIMWARVKGRAENRLASMPFAAVWLFRPAYVQPLKGVRSRTRLYNASYAALGPLYPLLRFLVPKWVTTTRSVGLALIRAARDGAPRPIIENADINALADAESGYLERL
jgi:uncharacterized protein YbjT (DUF2867 family)